MNRGEPNETGPYRFSSRNKKNSTSKMYSNHMLMNKKSSLSQQLVMRSVYLMTSSVYSISLGLPWLTALFRIVSESCSQIFKVSTWEWSGITVIEGCGQEAQHQPVSPKSSWQVSACCAAINVAGHICASGAEILPRWFYSAHVLRMLKHRGEAPFLTLFISILSLSRFSRRNDFFLWTLIWTLITMTAEALKLLGQPYNFFSILASFNELLFP